ncbi:MULTISPECIES: D-glucuronyl C5-epimerase family protein [Pseudomonas]|uniref:D-glucuronyl C5-epimerase family protein n=1 Tax=Pseudomonas TaxID=286 RepID=UPI0009BFBBB4|nr:MULTISPECIES: D-glucuronyl C5-epimerase family protein [Pseudomonas]MCL8307606.1 D-glucuronyl C5-epimerase family protein [Pseudomonas putida]
MDMKKACFAAILSAATQCVFADESISKNVEGQCPTIGVAERTPYAPGLSYATSGKFTLREDGITLFDYGTNYNNLGKWANPYFNSNFAYALYRDWLQTKCTDDDLKNRFLRVADWYIETAEFKNGMALWTYPFHNQYFDLDPGWISGIGQARVAGVLYRANAVSPKEAYKKTADLAMEAYTHEITEGGVITRDNGVTWIEEAPDPKGRSFKVLNGHITALSGLVDIYEITKDQRWKDLIQQGQAAVSRDLTKFDGGFISFFSLDWPSPTRRMSERGGYNSLHVEQLLWMYEYFQDPKYLKWASHFQSYEMNSDKYTASYSVNEKTNGPERTKAVLFGASWTTNEYPTTFTITPEKPTRVKGIAIDALDLARRPVDFTVIAYMKGREVARKEVVGNEELWSDILFKFPVLADKIDITFTKGNRITAITSIMAIRRDVDLAPVTNRCNYRRKSGTNDIVYTLNGAMSEDPNEKMPVRCDGWVFLPMEKGKPYLRARAHGVKGAEFTIFESWDMKKWKEVKRVPISSGERIRINAKYAKIEFKREAHEITQISTAVK